NRGGDYPFPANSTRPLGATGRMAAGYEGFFRADYTTGAGSPGQGLGAIRRQAQVFDVWSEVFDVWSDAGGAVVLARIYPERSRDEDLDYGALRVPLGRETVCGDAWF